MSKLNIQSVTPWWIAQLLVRKKLRIDTTIQKIWNNRGNAAVPYLHLFTNYDLLIKLNNNMLKYYLILSELAIN